MSFIGKILVVMQLVMSICLMAFAAAVSTYQTNWKVKADGLEKQLTEQRANFAKLEQDSKLAADNHNKDLKAQTDLAEQAKVKSEQLQREVVTLAQVNDELKKESAQKQQLQKDLAVDVLNRHEEVKELRGQLKQAREDRDKEYKAKEFLETTIYDLKTDISRLNAMTKEQLRLNEQYRRVLISKGFPTEIPDIVAVTAPAPKGLQGKVRDVMKNPDGGDVLIQTSIGENDGLSKGHILKVYRGSNFLGRALVITVGADHAVCRMLGTTRGKIEKGDDVATQLVN
jgi:hypothetical protein